MTRQSLIRIGTWAVRLQRGDLFYLGEEGDDQTPEVKKFLCYVA